MSLPQISRRIACLCLPFVSIPVHAQTGGTSEDRAIQALFECRDRTDGQQRLQCFDAAIARLASARSAPAVSRSEPEARSALDLATEQDIHGRPAPRTGDDQSPQPSEFTGVVARVWPIQGATRWRFALEDGTKWETLAAGSLVDATGEVTIRTGALGTYFAKFRGVPSIRLQADRIGLRFRLGPLDVHRVDAGGWPFIARPTQANGARANMSTHGAMAAS